MTYKKRIIFGVLTALAVVFIVFKFSHKNKPAMESKEVPVSYGDIRKAVTATAAVQPQNRLEMKPPVAGRVDKILVKEGEEVKTGQMVALMSSTERAALLDAASSQSAEEQAKWNEIYKPIPLIAPIDGTVIVSTMQPGQTVAQTDAVLVLSDRLIVQAQVDETDIGRVKEGQDAVITLDAYPDISVKASVSHIYHESKVVNNVTIYQVDILPKEIPPVFRSGMSANVQMIEESKEHVLVIPQEAVKRGKNKEGSFVFVSQGKNKKPEKREIKLGMSDDNNVEVVSGLDENDKLVIVTKKAGAPPKGPKPGSNPFMPSGGRR